MGVNTLVFDGDCAFCRSCVTWLERRLAGQVAIVAWQEADLSALGLTEAACRDAVQWVPASGTVRSGASAVAACLGSTRGAWPLVGRLIGSAPLRGLAERVYALTARNRACLVQEGHEVVEGGGFDPQQ